MVAAILFRAAAPHRPISVGAELLLSQTVGERVVHAVYVVANRKMRERKRVILGCGGVGFEDTDLWDMQAADGGKIWPID